MPNELNISDSTKRNLAKQVGEQLSILAPEIVKDKAVSLTDDFAVWTLRQKSLEQVAEGFDKVPTHLAGLAEQTNRWHHQIIADGNPIAFARSIPATHGLRTVTDLVLSPIAKHIEEAIDWIEETVEGEPEDARLLPIPAFYLHTLWLVEKERDGTDHVVIADVPKQIKQFKQKSYLGTAQFFESVRKTIPSRTPQIARQAADNIDERLREKKVIRIGDLSRRFANFGFKRLSAHEVDPNTSRGHEFQGVSRLVSVLGTPTGHQLRRAKVVYLGADPEDPAHSQFGSTTWYNAREGTSRNAEYRLYYTASLSVIQEHAEAGDFMVIASDYDGNLFLFIASGDSVVEQHLRWLFGDSIMLTGAPMHTVARTATRIINATRQTQ